MTIHAYTDGTSRGNPGHSGIGFVLKTESGEVLHTEHDYIGIATNNIAEYTALLKCLDRVSSLIGAQPPLDCSSLIVHSDSELMVRQINGQYKIKSIHLKKHITEVQRIVSEAPFRFAIRYIPRELNTLADKLANHGIDCR